MYMDTAKKEMAYERVDTVRKIIVNCIEDWPKVRMDRSHHNQLYRPFEKLLSLPYNSLSYLEASSGKAYYLGETRNGLPHGLGMHFTDMGDWHYCKMYIGEWAAGERSGGDGVYFSFCGDEMDWYIQHQTHSNYGKTINFQISWKGLASYR